MKLLAASLLVVLMLVSVPSAEAAERQRCPRGGTTLARSDDARIWRVGSEVRRYYGCAFDVGRVFRLDPRHGQVVENRAKLKLAGMIAAYEVAGGEFVWTVVVRSLRTGRVVHRATSNARGTGDGRTGPVVRLLLKRNGSVAWTASVDCVCEEVDYSVNGWEVHSIGRDGRRVVHDSGPQVDPDSLAFADGNGAITWSRGGQTQTARLR